MSYLKVLKGLIWSIQCCKRNNTFQGFHSAAGPNVPGHANAVQLLKLRKVTHGDFSTPTWKPHVLIDLMSVAVAMQSQPAIRRASTC